ncbi:MAG: hypothetical protein R3C20_04200 [Planctomycetaceae bacterium]
MTGLIWLVQLVHYPLMANVGPAQFVQYEKAHCQKITPIVFPLMMLELISSIWIAFRPPVASPFSASAGLWNSLALATILIWLSTALVQVPLHRKLENGFESGVHRRLVRSNWLRTLLWSVRSAGLGWILLG